MKVLLVDDEPTSRRMLNRILVKQFGCEVIEATNGAEALDQLPKHEFTFVLLDLVMPVLNGVETLEAIRESETLSTLPVIVLSAVTEEAAVRRMLQLGVGDYLAKPLYPIQITGRLQRFIATLAETAVFLHEHQRYEGWCVLFLREHFEHLSYLYP